jgi:hypothetical protein
MKKLLTATLITLTLGSANAQYTTECRRDYWGTVVCETSVSPLHQMLSMQREQEQRQRHEEELKLRWEMVRQQCSGLWLTTDYNTGAGTCVRF